MDKKQLGNSELHLSPIGFGAWAIGGGDWAFAWGPQDDSDSIAAIHKALDLGINWIDTAAVYGLGHSEEVVARALKSTSQQPYVFTKSTMVWDDKKEITNSQKQIRRECEASLRRLQLDQPGMDPSCAVAHQAEVHLDEQGMTAFVGHVELSRNGFRGNCHVLGRVELAN